MATNSNLISTSLATPSSSTQTFIDSTSKLYSNSTFGFLSASALRSGNLPTGGQVTLPQTPVAASFNNTDMRIKLSLPTGYQNSAIMNILGPNNGFVFPYTPQIEMQSTASYSMIDTSQTNFQFLAYNNTRIEQLNIRGDFYCENQQDALFWIASVHYLRSITKMHYGDSSNAGAPPPVVKLNGYGSFVFNNIPVVVITYNVELPKDVDYMSVTLNPEFNQWAGPLQLPQFSGTAAPGTAWVPVRSTISVTVQPIYSRTKAKNFSLDQFVSGNYVFNGAGYV